MSIQINFANKKVLVTGGGNGIGQAVCHKLHKQGAIVYALDCNEAALEKLVQECPGVKTVHVDLLNWEETRKKVTSLGHLNCLVNCAGIVLLKSFMGTTSEDFDKLMGINVKAIINVSQVVAQGMIDAKQGGSIVNISSLASRFGTQKSVVYSLTKAAVDMLTKSMAVELGPHQIRVNSVNPIFIMTELSRPFFEGPGTKIKEILLGRTPLGRVAELDEVVNTILFLLSNVAPMIHGESVFIDGGYSAS